MRIVTLTFLDDNAADSLFFDLSERLGELRITAIRTEKVVAPRLVEAHCREHKKTVSVDGPNDEVRHVRPVGPCASERFIVETRREVDRAGVQSLLRIRPEGDV